MSASLRYAAKRGGLAVPVGEHARALAEAIVKAVRDNHAARKPRPIEEVLAPLLETALVIVHEAGARSGEARAVAGLEEHLRASLRRAVETIAVPPARCPHCVGGRTDYGDCRECGGSGAHGARGKD